MSDARAESAAALPPSILPQSHRGWMAQLLHRAIQAPFLKLVGIPLWVALFFVAYFWILRHPLSVTQIMPVTALDRAIGFHAAAFPWYVTLWVYVSLPPGFTANRRELVEYGIAIGLMCIVALLCFMLWPSAVPHELLEARSGPGMGILMSVDAAGNACPSMHVAAALFSAIWIERQLRRVAAPGAWRVASAVWCVLIIYATMATKQHVAYDVVGGLVLGAVAARLSLLMPSLASYATQRSPAGGSA